MNTKIEDLSIATIRSMVIDVINKANSGHPGMALGSAPILYTLFTKYLVSTPKDSKWINRDRFVLSSGHASSLLYTLLHLAGYKISIDDLKNFRQLNSITPGHPEVNFTDGVDATSGPLGQGVAQAVGMALAESHLSALYEDGEKLINHYTYCLCGDGDLEEGISQEAISFAGLNELNKLILFYDANNVTLDGDLELSFNEDVKQRFHSAHWNVIEVADGNSVSAIDEAIKIARTSKNKPTLIMVHTVIGYGSAKQGTSKVHGSPLGVEDGHNAKVNVYHFDHEDFYVPKEVYDHFKETYGARGNRALRKYKDNLQVYKKEHKKDYEAFISHMNGKISDDIKSVKLKAEKGSDLSSRKSSGKYLNMFSEASKVLFGGSADVAGSVLTKLNNGTTYSKENRKGNNLNFGIREFAMASIQNGVLLHSGLRTYVGCFFVFSDYMKPAIRMACLSGLPAIYLFSHDSLAVGEDGPTHQPIEQLAMLRSMPYLTTIRPCDEKETFGAYQYALNNTKNPVALILSRQNLPLLSSSNPDLVKRGGYVVYQASKTPSFELIATGSEVNLAIEASKLLKKHKIFVNVISLPSFELFEAQNSKYKASVLTLNREKRISVEMATSFGWDKYAEHHISVETFGKSAPANDVLSDYGFTATNVADYIKKLL